MVQAIEQCTAKAITRLQLYHWLSFNYLLGNGNNHLKNTSFHISHEGLPLAPTYDLRSTAVLHPIIQQRPLRPRTQLALSLGKARWFEQVNRANILQAGTSLGLSKKAAMREVEKMLKALPVQANRLIAEIEASYPDCVAASPNPERAAHYQAGALRLLYSIQPYHLAEDTSKASIRL